MKKGKVSAAPSTDLLVCFPSRAQLALMPKPICSPARANETSKRHPNHHLKKLSKSGLGGGPAQASPILWTRPTPTMNNHAGGRGDHHHHHHDEEELSSEPTSPKVTCAGQIKVRPSRGTGSRSWQSVMEEIERIHHNGKKREMGGGGSKRVMGELFGFKKDAMQFLSCLRNLRLDFRCFGSFPGQDILSDDDDEEEEDDDDHDENPEEGNHDDEEGEEEESSRAVFSKWFMVLQENENDDVGKGKETNHCAGYDNNSEENSIVVPPKNALLLMRCRSAPAMSRLEEKAKQEQLLQQQQKQEEESEQKVKEVKDEKEQVEVKKERETLAMVMRYDSDFYELSSDIAKETWLVDGLMSMDAAGVASARCNSWKR